MSLRILLGVTCLIVSHLSIGNDHFERADFIDTEDISACKGQATAEKPINVQVSDFSQGLFDTSPWPARWYCGEWSSFHGWFSIFSDTLIGLSYFTIPFFLFFFLFRKKVPVELKHIFRLFMAFILLCGTTHFMEVLLFWWPAYRLNTLVSFATAIVSMGTVFALIRTLPTALKYRSPEEADELINELRLSKEKLAKSEARFKQLLESTPDAMVIVNQSGEIVFINAQTEKLFGYTKEEIYGKRVEKLMPERLILDHQKHRKSYHHSPKTRMMGEGRELLGTRKDGKDFPVAISLNPIQTGEETLVAAGIRDITRQKKAEHTIRSLNQSLEKKVEERTLMLTEKTLELERRSKEMEQFAFLASHDLKAPLTNIESLIQILDHKGLVQQEGDTLMKKLKQTVLDSKEKLESINYVMSIKKDQEVKNEKTNISEALEQVTSSIEESITTTNTIINSNIKKTTSVNFPSIYLKTVLQNLITNAIKYHQPGRDPVINISVYEKDGFQCLEVEDNGRGINIERYGNKLFGLFQRFHLDTEGKGVGLYITKSIIENYKGKIIVGSTVGEGTSFTIFFPLN